MTDFQNPAPQQPAGWDEQYIRMLLNSGMPNPAAVPNQIDDYGGVLTDFNKVGNLGTDLDWAMMSGQLGPEAFDPITTYDSVEAPGDQRLREYMVGNPLQQVIALAIEDGARGSEIVNRVMAEAQADPTLLDYAPKQFKQDQVTGLYEESEEPDIRALQDEISTLEAGVGSDPAFQMIDGQRMSATTDDSPARKAWLEAGYTSDPQATYDPYMLAAPGRREYDMELRDDASERSRALPATQQAYQRALGLAKDERSAQMAAERYPDMTRRLQENDSLTASPRGTSDPRRLAAIARERESRPLGVGFGQQQSNAGPSVGGEQTRTSGTAISSYVREMLGNRSPERTLAAQKEAARQGIQARGDARENTLAQARANFAREDDEKRQAIARELQRQGYSPGYDEIRGRNAFTFGGALG